MIIKLLFLLGLLLPIFFVFRAFFYPGPLVFGDAPFFYSEGLYNWVSEPYSWSSFGNNFSGVNLFLWIYPLMYLYGALHLFLGLNNDSIIRILFYFPAVTLSIIGPMLFARYLAYGKKVQFFASLVYCFNTYFLLLIDGGQVGVALAYGIFPLSFLYLRKLLDKKSINNFLAATLLLFLLTIADPRIAAICLAANLIWLLMETIIHKLSLKKSFQDVFTRFSYGNLSIFKKLLLIFLSGLVLIPLNSYWIIPTLSLNQNFIIESLDSEVVTLLNPFLLFQPHWPFNEFGKISTPPLYFGLLPFLLFGALFFKRDKKILVFTLSFLILAFFVKGGAPPLGQFYDFVINNVPFGIAFRDSTKFFTPLLLFAGILIGVTIELLPKKLKGLFVILAYIYILFLVHPAILGQLSGVLKIREVPRDYEIIANKLDEEDGFLRTAWFPERPPFAFHSEAKPALDAKNLVWERPFASLNVGTFDHFNFLHQKDSIELFKLLGIKYLFFPGDSRKGHLSKEEQEDWNNLLSLMEGTPGIKKENWNTSFPIFSIIDTKPRIFGVNKLMVVVGDNNINDKLSPDNYASVFIEDGKIDPKRLQNIASTAATLVFNDKEIIDLTMSFLQKYYLDIGKNISSQWAIREAEQFLKWKYELLSRGIKTYEFDFGKGIAFSDQVREEIVFELTAGQDGEYILAARTMSSPQDDHLGIIFEGEEFNVSHDRSNLFKWFVKNITLQKGKYKITFRNYEGLSVLNTVALIPKKDFLAAEDLTAVFLDKFTLKGESTWQLVEYKRVSPVEYQVNPSPSVNWIVFTDKYSDKWVNSYPFYSMVNGFYVESGTGEVAIKFEGQEYVKIGVTISIISLLAMTGLLFWVNFRK